MQGPPHAVPSSLPTPVAEGIVWPQKTTQSHNMKRSQNLPSMATFRIWVTPVCHRCTHGCLKRQTINSVIGFQKQNKALPCPPVPHASHFAPAAGMLLPRFLSVLPGYLYGSLTNIKTYSYFPSFSTNHNMSNRLFCILFSHLTCGTGAPLCT